MNDSLVRSPWEEHFQTDCFEAEEIQPLFHFRSSYEKYSYLREILPIFFRQRNFNETISSQKFQFSYQFANDPLNSALQCLFNLDLCHFSDQRPRDICSRGSYLKREGVKQPLPVLNNLSVRLPPNVRGQIDEAGGPKNDISRDNDLPNSMVYPDLSVRYPLVLNCQLALLWALIGKVYNRPDFTQASESFAAILKPLILAGLTTLWTREDQYEKQELQLTMGVFLDAIGCASLSRQYYQSNLPKSRFFSWLYSQKLQINVEKNPDSSLILQNAGFSFAMADRGEKIPFGALSAGKIKIPAMGPLVGNLSDSSCFGMTKIIESQNWFTSSRFYQTWFFFELISMEDKKMKIMLNHTGSDAAVYFAFYVKAQSCCIDHQIFKPNCLQRFKGKSNYLEFITSDEKISFSFEYPVPLEMIPLSGGDSFWGATFMLAIAINRGVNLSMMIAK